MEMGEDNDTQVIMRRESYFIRREEEQNHENKTDITRNEGR